jgi:hypothetical protein
MSEKSAYSSYLHRRYEAAAKAAERLAALRDEVQRQMLFGLASANAASAIALTAAFAGFKGKLEEIGLSSGLIAFAVSAFLVGTWFSAHAIFAFHTRLIEDAGEAEIKSSKLAYAADHIDDEHVGTKAAKDAEKAFGMHIPKFRGRDRVQTLMMVSGVCWGGSVLALALNLAFAAARPDARFFGMWLMERLEGA